MIGSTYLDYDSTLNKSFKMLRDDKLKSFGLFVICGINLGLRIDDLRKLSFDDLRQDEINLIEGKTKKKRTVKVNEHIKLALTHFNGSRGSAFVSQKGTAFSSQHINRLLKKHFKGVGGGVVSSHSLRKTFGRRVWDNNSQSDAALIKLGQLFNHSSTSVTRIYLGIQQEELNDIYMNL